MVQFCINLCSLNLREGLVEVKAPLVVYKVIFGFYCNKVRHELILAIERSLTYLVLNCVPDAFGLTMVAGTFPIFEFRFEAFNARYDSHWTSNLVCSQVCGPK